MKKEVTESIILGETPETAPLEVIRVAHGSGTHIEPAIEETWADIDKLRWHLGVLKADTGLVVNVSETSPGVFSLHGATKSGGWGISSRDFYSTWTYINGIIQGAELMMGE